MKSALERFWDKVDKSSDGCWRWVASLNESGYGQFFVGAKRWRAHRFAYTMEVGEIPAGFELDHLCRNRACVNPSHLEPVSRRENQRRGRREGGPVTIVYRAYSPSRDRAGSTYADRVRAVSQAAVRNQFVECDPESVWPADWFVQAGRVVWGIDE